MLVNIDDATTPVFLPQLYPVLYRVRRVVEGIAVTLSCFEVRVLERHVPIAIFLRHARRVRILHPSKYP